MFGQNNLMAKTIHLFLNMDKMIGGQFEKGLASMNPSWRQRPSNDAATFSSRIVEA
jgi:hypothetical protein